MTFGAAAIHVRNDTILILAEPAEPHLRQLEKSLAGVNIIAGN